MPTPVYVLAGQSNASKFARRKDIETNLIETGRAGVTSTTAQGASGMTANTDAGVEDWFAPDDGDRDTGELFRQLCNDTARALEKVDEGFVRSFLWIHGEKDAGNYTSAEAYETRMTELILGLRQTFGEGFNFTILKLADAMPRSKHSKGWEIVQQAQETLAARFDFVTVLNPDQIIADAGLVFEDALEDIGHYGPDGGTALTNAYMAQFPTNEIWGTADADVIDAPIQSSFIHTGAGADTIKGGDRPDQIMAGQGDDTVSGGNSRDVLFGGAGLDDMRGGAGNDRIIGGGGGDTLTGGNGNDRLYGGGAADHVFGGNGNDRIWGAAGDDTLGGNAGRDVIVAGRGTDRIIAGTGDDKALGGAGADQLIGGGGDDWLSGQSGGDRILGGDGQDSLFGQGGADVLLGDSGRDMLFGGNNADQLRGGGHSDRLFGGGGADLLNGNAGDDHLTGGAQADSFQFARSAGDDVITDFQNGHDVIDLTTFELRASDFDTFILPALTAAGGGATLLTLDALGGNGTIRIEGLGLRHVDISDFVL